MLPGGQAGNRRRGLAAFFFCFYVRYFCAVHLHAGDLISFHSGGIPGQGQQAGGSVVGRADFNLRLRQSQGRAAKQQRQAQPI